MEDLCDIRLNYLHGYDKVYNNMILFDPSVDEEIPANTTLRQEEETINDTLAQLADQRKQLEEENGKLKNQIETINSFYEATTEELWRIDYQFYQLEERVELEKKLGPVSTSSTLFPQKLLDDLKCRVDRIKSDAAKRFAAVPRERGRCNEVAKFVAEVLAQPDPIGGPDDNLVAKSLDHWLPAGGDTGLDDGPTSPHQGG